MSDYERAERAAAGLAAELTAAEERAERAERALSRTTKAWFDACLEAEAEVKILRGVVQRYEDILENVTIWVEAGSDEEGAEMALALIRGAQAKPSTAPKAVNPGGGAAGGPGGGAHG